MTRLITQLKDVWRAHQQVVSLQQRVAALEKAVVFLSAQVRASQAKPKAKVPRKPRVKKA